ncbi:FecR family protein [Roseibium salinum]|uniref:FecR domain-containing protein n=1 Tax=Roseibium salinum TaxID=1604349 RepID=A0ABT3QXL3_9HYPH|nr:FecR domain-containing protein [Roseibium sp. DSM 29163]MCX2721652.1 FecR domain-containing protein [Roseibium sp. DSM 29163]
MRLAPVAVAISLSAILSTAAVAGKVGVTVDAARTVKATGGASARTVRIHTDIFENDRLRADASGNAQIRLVDGTKIVVGPNADVKIDEFVYSSSSSVEKLTVSATRGAFRFISGSSGSAAYSIKTPNGTIGVRGTAFDVTITPQGTNIALLRGALTVCDRAQNCREVRNRCDYVLVGRGGVSQGRLNSDAVRGRTKTLFPLLEDETGLQPQFKQYSAGCTTVRTRNSPDPVERPATVPINAPPGLPAAEPAPAAANVPNNPGNGRAVGNAGEKFNDGARGNSVNAPGRNK